MKTERSFYLGVIAVLAIIILFQRSCSSSKCKRLHCDDLKTTVVVKTDTTYVEKKDSTHWHQPKQLSSSSQTQEPVVIYIDTSFSQEPVDVFKGNRDSLAIVDYWIAHHYSDTNNVDGGQVIVENTVLANRLAMQRVITSLKERTIERTIEKTIVQKQKGQFYVGIVAQGEKNDLLTGFGLSALLKTKRDKIWTVSALYDKRFGSMFYQAGTLFKISFK